MVDYVWKIPEIIEYDGAQTFEPAETIADKCDELSHKSLDCPVSLYDVLEALGVVNDSNKHMRQHYKFYGWGPDGKEFHLFTEKELHPEGCPCCGRPW